jgi:uncharacterized membrane protein YjjP (DUF1212 family)
MDETPDKPAPAHTSADLLEFLYRLGQGYLACGEQTAQVELQLRRIALSYGARRVRVVAFPTALFITMHDGEQERVTLAEGPLQGLRLDQMADIYTLGADAQEGRVSVADGLKRLTDINRSVARFGLVGGVLGHLVLSVGIAMVLNPTVANLIVAGSLGMLVGVIKSMNRGRGVLSVPISVVMSTFVSACVFLLDRYGVPIDPVQALIPPLVTFLPGGMLTFGMIELAYGDMVSGASRLISGFVQLFLLAFGIAAGATLTGVTLGGPPATEVHLGSMLLAPWLGAMIFGVGVSLHFSAPRNALPWMLLVLLLAFSAQRAAATVIGDQFSGFFGTLVATPLVYLIQLRFNGPPPMVTFLASFWLLVPGSLGLLSVKSLLSDYERGIEGMITVVFVIVSIALGTLLGASLYKWLSERLGSWRLQIGRAERRTARAPKKPDGG